MEVFHALDHHCDPARTVGVGNGWWDWWQFHPRRVGGRCGRVCDQSHHDRPKSTPVGGQSGLRRRATRRPQLQRRP